MFIKRIVFLNKSIYGPNEPSDTTKVDFLHPFLFRLSHLEFSKRFEHTKIFQKLKNCSRGVQLLLKKSKRDYE